MRIFLRRGMVKRYFPCSRRHISSLLVFVFLFASIASIGASVVLWSSAAEAQGSEKPILHRNHPLVQEAIEVQHRHLNRLMGIPDVVGSGVGIGPDGLPAIKVFTTRPGVRGIPEWLESIPVQVEVTGMVVALTDPTARFSHPVPIGVSTGHPDITAGTIGCRLTDDTNVYALSNNHVYANSDDGYYPNEANSILRDGFGDIVLQPGSLDGGIYPADEIGTLYDFEPIDFSLSGENYIDAAIALSSPEWLGNSTPPDDMNNKVGYGTPSSQIIDETELLLELPVQKYGRTTGMTYGKVDAFVPFVEVCYEAIYIPIWDIYFCIKSAYFYDQIKISSTSAEGFSGWGDSGSLIVTVGGNKPVGLLFAGSETATFANRIDRVLGTFSQRLGRDVWIDDEGGSTPTQPSAPTDLTATPVSSSQIDLTWRDWSDNEAGFKIERCTGSGCGDSDFAQIDTVGADITTYSNTGLLPSTTYTYRVRAYNAGGDSNYSEPPASATTLAASELPARPTNLTAEAVSRRRIVLSWTDESTNEEGFKIERCKGSTCTNFEQIAIVGPDVNNYSDNRLRRKTTYRYRVRAYNKAGNSAYSDIASATTFATRFR